MSDHMPPVAPSPVTLFAGEQTCQLVRTHHPVPVLLQHHHQKPQELQRRLWGEVRYGPSLWVCGTCHDSIHAWLYFLLGEHARPPDTGGVARREAGETLAWFRAEERKADERAAGTL